MINNYNVLGVIPARGGSKRIPRKNIKRLAGKPLLQYTLEELVGSRYVDRTIIITDDDEIAALAKQYGVEQPFIEPSRLADGSLADYDFFQYALEWLREHESYTPDIVVQLRPTSPLRTAEQIDHAIEMLVEAGDGADSVRSVAIPEQSPYKMYKIVDGVLVPLLTIRGKTESFNLPGQQLPPAYKHVGYLDVVWARTILEKHKMTGDRILPYIIEGAVSGINTPEDWEYYEYLFSKKRIEPSLARIAKNIKAVALDADGVLFSGQVFLHHTEGEFLKERSYYDGQAISLLRAAGLPVIIITAENTPFTNRVVEKLNSLPSAKSGAWPPLVLFSGSIGKDKKTVLMDWLAAHHIDSVHCAYMGDDVGDIAVLESVGLPAAPQQAHEEIKKRALYVAPHPGGRGAVRDLADLIITSKGLDSTVLPLR